MSFFIEPFFYEFMQNSLICGLTVSTICAYLSCYLIFKGWSLIGDAISHAVLPGVVLAYILQIPLIIGAFFSGISCALLAGFIQERCRVKNSAVLGIVFVGMFALGLVMFTQIETDTHLMHILFGNILGVSKLQTMQIITISSIIFIIITLLRKQLALYVFDSVHAKIAGININALHYLLLILVTVTTVIAVQVVGVVLVIAMLITPAMIARVITTKFAYMPLIAIIAATSSTYIGIVLSFHYNCATNAAIVLTQSSIFCLVFVFKQIVLFFKQSFLPLNQGKLTSSND